ncbi:hypothetical protein EG346_15150 [Chryseobacterium carnipullorum]|uniref:Uncharacterized protein n=1 Tax=Chryseobacterium carnipullorum TaxID=1124835 RepID=A0A376DRT1_CHRCU|nr:hypothetical protein [Chryseobacterium carnipullorum]AZA49434.1 hypothetical protein EG346_15150 [Chryseobacterium carnipullorum]AZA64325.1 hypothetical protein EG345_06105 [Chryseobacterium carnipullorum]STC94338.1 Uncharacterised protein [Chryseobacterium carnipullorum]
MKKIIIIYGLLSAGSVFAQIGINTKNPNSTLSVNGSLEGKYNQITNSYTLTHTDFLVSYTGDSDAIITLPSVGSGSSSFAGRFYRIKNISTSNITLQPSDGNFIRSTDLTGVPNFLIPPGNYVEVVNNNNPSAAGVATWDLTFIASTTVINSSTDATRFLGGTVYVKYAQNTGGTLTGKTINENYNVGANNTNIPPTIGGINSLLGSGYTVSNPSAGIFDIKFDTLFTDIYGISVNITDAYGNSVTAGQNPDPTRTGSSLKSNDNSQVSFISNSIIRIKTGDSNGGLSNRPFTFLVTGK